MTRVLHVITSLKRGGAEAMLVKLLSGMDPQRFENHVATIVEGGALRPTIEALGVPVADLEARSTAAAPNAVFRLLRLIRQLDPDVVQTWLYHSDLVGTIASRMARVPVLWRISCSDMEMRHYSRQSRMTLKLLPWLSKLPEAIISNSEAGRRSHVALGYRPKRWVLIPNGFDTEKFRPDPEMRVKMRADLGIDASTPVVGMVARYDPHKDHRNFIEAASRFSKHRRDSRFLLVGRDVTERNSELVGLIEGAGLAGRVVLLGERQDISDVVQSFDIATLTSISEGFPNVVGEAMASAVPCVVTDVGDSAAIVGETGRVVPPGDGAALAAAWKELSEIEVSQRVALGNAGRKRIIEQYALPRIVTQFEDLYARVCQQAAR